MLRATVVAILSGKDFSDGERRIELQFEGAEIMYKKIRIPESMLGTPATLDAEVTLFVDTKVATAKKAGHQS